MERLSAGSDGPIRDDDAERERPEREPAEPVAAGEEDDNLRFGDLLGEDIPPPALLFRCPRCDYTWAQQFVGEEPGICPNHQLELLRYDAGRTA